MTRPEALSPALPFREQKGAPTMLVDRSRRWYALALVCVAQFMVVLDVAIVNVALPTIQVDLGFSRDDLQWIVSAYTLTFGGFLLLGGRAADLLGRRPFSWSASSCSRSHPFPAGSPSRTPG